jgi:hypothetical protein
MRAYYSVSTEVIVMKSFARLLFALLLTAFLLPAGARADSIAAGDQAAIKSLIEGQIDAFQRDDGAAAYGYASPNLHGLFPSIDQFMQMVKRGYAPVYRPRSVTFGNLVDSPVGPLQKVFVVGPDGKGYVAVYSLQRQPDGTWKINGCTLVEDTGASI